MSIIKPARFIKTMQKNAALYQMLLGGVSQEQATQARDGADGWNVVEVLCHLRDFDGIFLTRAMQIVEQDNPTLTPYDHEALALENRYSEQVLADVLAAFLAHRQKFTDWYAERAEADWGRTATHPESGRLTLLDTAVQAATHDIDHLEQIVRILQS